MKTLVIAAGALALASTAALADPGINWARVQETYPGQAPVVRTQDSGYVGAVSERRENARDARAARQARNGEPSRLGWRQ
ncbi:hypothetical protein [Hansschlegelia sp.]|uniref:hypothetical protein n=1 Tax=Hansschlegelia sp. TaxID=2041892 RepID=UPI002B8C2E8F|nr:hypothetical protein [Hansschlegelia sp.]HVI29863.1 hypothetical protein [Hansschlegelia sp.]